MLDDNPRPQKRMRIVSVVEDMTSPSQSPFASQSTLTPPPLSPVKPSVSFRPLPPYILLLAIPHLLTHSPTHRNYIIFLRLSLASLRKCLTLPSLPPEIECRAWCGLAELGMKIISGGFWEDSAHPWAHGIETEVRIH